MTSARVLVTGAAGFVGGHLVAALSARGAEVHGFGLGPPRVGPSHAGWHSGDLLKPRQLAEVVAAVRPNQIVHLAGQSSAAASFVQPVDTYRVNVLGTWTVLRAACEHAPHARVLIVGSGEAYGPQPEGSRVSEDAPFRPVSPYALSKAAADTVAEAFARRYGLDVLRARSFGHTGPGQSPVFSLPSFARQIAAIEAGWAEPVIKVGNLDVTRDLTDVRDVVDAYIALLDRGRPGAVYNVCRGKGEHLRVVVARMVERAHAEVSVEVDPALVRQADIPWLVGDPAAISRDTGWSAATPLERTLEDLLEYWRGCCSQS